MTILIKELKDMDPASWISFCDDNPNAWLHHKGIAFINDNSNLSFVLKGENKILALCPVIIENKDYDKTTFNIGR